MIAHNRAIEVSVLVRFHLLFKDRCLGGGVGGGGVPGGALWLKVWLQQTGGGSVTCSLCHGEDIPIQIFPDGCGLLQQNNAPPSCGFGAQQWVCGDDVIQRGALWVWGSVVAPSCCWYFRLLVDHRSLLTSWNVLEQDAENSSHHRIVGVWTRAVNPESWLVVLPIPYVGVKGWTQPWNTKMSIYTSMEAHLDSFLGHPIVMNQK